jgi:hypothetical protein
VDEKQDFEDVGVKPWKRVLIKSELNNSNPASWLKEAFLHENGSRPNRQTADILHLFTPPVV